MQLLKLLKYEKLLKTKFIICRTKKLNKCKQIIEENIWKPMITALSW